MGKGPPISTAHLKKGQGENTEVNSLGGACFLSENL